MVIPHFLNKMILQWDKSDMVCCTVDGSEIRLASYYVGYPIYQVYTLLLQDFFHQQYDLP